jgi:hypothetical protein
MTMPRCRARMLFRSLHSLSRLCRRGSLLAAERAWNFSRGGLEDRAATTGWIATQHRRAIEVARRVPNHSVRKCSVRSARLSCTVRSPGRVERRSWLGDTPIPITTSILPRPKPRSPVVLGYLSVPGFAKKRSFAATSYGQFEMFNAQQMDCIILAGCAARDIS